MSFTKCRGGGNKLSNVGGFSILRPGKALTYFNKGNCTYFLDEKKVQLSFSRNLFFWEYARKILSQHVLVVVVVFESKGLQC